MSDNFLREEIIFSVEFYDVDSMSVVWHGNYVKFMEKARCALLDKIGFGYLAMKDAGYMFPVVDIKVKYVKSLRFGEKVRAVAMLVEYENRIKIKYEFYNAETGELTTKAESSQMAVKIETGESEFVCPASFIEKVEALMKSEK